MLTPGMIQCSSLRKLTCRDLTCSSNLCSTLRDNKECIMMMEQMARTKISPSSEMKRSSTFVGSAWSLVSSFAVMIAQVLSMQIALGTPKRALEANGSVTSAKLSDTESQETFPEWLPTRSLYAMSLQKLDAHLGK